MINSFFCDFKNFGLDVRLSGGIVELIFKRYLKTILKSPRIGIGFVSPFIALKIPYDQSTETKTHGSRNQ
jgi:hypothetical protein